MIELQKHVFRILKKVDYHHCKTRLKKTTLSLFIGIIIAGVSFIIISPLLGLLSEAFMHIDDVYNPIVYLIPEKFTLYNVQMALEQLNYIAALSTTIVFCGLMMLMQAFISSLVGYGFARFNFPGSGLLFAGVILTIIVPSQTIMVPLFMQFRFFGPLEMNLIDTFYPIIILTLTGVGLRSGLYIFIFRQFYKGLPKEIEEAAFIDGAGPFRTYFTVMLPNAMPSLITVMLFSFVWQYNDIFFTTLFMKDSGLLAGRIASLAPLISQGLDIRNPYQVSLILNSGILFTILPLIFIYLFMQRYFMEGIERSGIVG